MENGTTAPSRVMVTGASGFLGKYVCHELKRNGCEVLPIARRDGFQLETESHALSAVLTTRPSVVIHLARGLANEGADPASTFRDTLRMGLNVLDACVLAQAKFVTVAPRTVYAPSTFFARSGVKTLAEGLFHVGSPSDAEGDAKRAIAAACSRYQAQYKRPYTFLVLPPLYGPGALPNRSTIDFMMQSYLDLEELPEFGFQGLGANDMLEHLFVHDAARAVVKAALELDHDGPVNIAGFDPVKRSEVGQKISQAVGYGGTAQFDPKEAEPLVPLDGALAAKGMQWKPSVTINEGIKMTAGWLKEEEPDTKEAETC